MQDLRVGGSCGREPERRKFHLLRYFKKAFQVKPHQFVIQCRLEKAIGLLKNQSLSISEVAIKSGFADAAAFSKAFKQRYGVSPGVSRKWDA
jgi:AraC family transcriptional regulator